MIKHIVLEPKLFGAMSTKKLKKLTVNLVVNSKTCADEKAKVS
jgi:hypothetical protein